MSPDVPSSRQVPAPGRQAAALPPDISPQALFSLVEAVQELSLARRYEDVARIVRTKARHLTGAEGATFVLRDGDLCYYADEDAISPLWKGQRFPVSQCVSGWAMENRQAAIVTDIFADPRVPVDAYEPTFVRSLVVVPIRQAAPIGGIGNYWATKRSPTAAEVSILQALADSTSIALENVELYRDLERRVETRTRELETANRDLGSFSHSVAHELRAPLTVIRGWSDILAGDDIEAAPAVRQGAQAIGQAVTRMADVLEGLIELSRAAQARPVQEHVDLSACAHAVVQGLAERYPHPVAVEIQPRLRAKGDPRLIGVVLENLLGNAWKYSSKSPRARISFTARSVQGETVFTVADTGVGFEPAAAEALFRPFSRLDNAAPFPGTGIGLATVNRIVQAHGGRIWAEGEPGVGARFHFTLAPADAS